MSPEGWSDERNMHGTPPKPRWGGGDKTPPFTASGREDSQSSADSVDHATKREDMTSKTSGEPPEVGDATQRMNDVPDGDDSNDPGSPWTPPGGGWDGRCRSGKPEDRVPSPAEKTKTEGDQISHDEWRHLFDKFWRQSRIRDDSYWEQMMRNTMLAWEIAILREEVRAGIMESVRNKIEAAVRVGSTSATMAFRGLSENQLQDVRRTVTDNLPNHFSVDVIKSCDLSSQAFLVVTWPDVIPQPRPAEADAEPNPRFEKVARIS